MGLIKKLTNRVFTGKAEQKNDRAKQKMLRRCYFEVMEQRRVLSADPVIAGITYLEGDAGQDSTPDHFEVTFEGGSDTTYMTQFTINGDQDSSGGLSDGDMFFDINDQLPGAGGHHAFQFDAANSFGVTAEDIQSISVSEDGLMLTVDVANFEAGDVLAFTIDVDEVERFRTDKIASGVEFEGSFFNATFEDQHFSFTDRDVSVIAEIDGGFMQLQQEGIFYDYYDSLLAAGENEINSLLQLQRNNETGQADRTAAAIDAYSLTPKPISISGTVYHDENVNCEHDADESGIAGVEIQLQKFNPQTSAYETVATTQTDAQGNYEFGTELGLMPGVYQLVETQPDGFLDVGAHEGSSGGTVRETAGGQQNIISNINIPLGNTAATDYDFKEVMPASLSGHVWHDQNDNGVFDANEQGIANVLIQVTRVGAKDTSVDDVFADTSPVLVRTDANGYYEVEQLPPGIYEVVEINTYATGEVDPLAGYLDGKDSIGSGATTVGQKSNDRFTQVELCAGDDGVNYDFGELKPVQISGFVSVATPEGNCLEPDDPNFMGLGGVTIELYDVNGDLVDTTQTNGQGLYEFSDLAPGTYTVVEVQPDGYLDGDQSVGSVDGTTMGAVGLNDEFTGITLTSGQEAVRYDFCENIPAELCGTVYYDANNNGVQDSGEMGIEGVRMQLLDANGNVLAEQFTDAEGNYCFDNLYPGEYCVKEFQPTDYVDGIDTAGDVNGVIRGVAENDKISNIMLGGGDSGQNYDFAEIRPAELCGTVYHDRNNNGVQDAGEEGIEGVRLVLTDMDGNVIAEQFTDAEGNYCFDGLNPGEYCIAETQPENYLDGKDSVGTVNGFVRGQAVNDKICNVTLTGGESGTEYNFGELKTGQISGQVHVDRDGDCVYDPADGERPLAGVTLELLNSDGEVIATTRTDQQGNYAFENLLPGEYSIRQLQPDSLFNGGEVVGDGGGTALENMIEGIVVSSGQKLTQYDFCEVEAAEIHGRVWEDGPAIATEDGNPVDGYRDLRDGVYQEGVDTPLAGVRMQLYYFIDPVNGSTIPRPVTLGEVQAEHYGHMGTTDPNAPVWAETMSNGEYWFLGLPAGNYIVLQEQPDGYYDSNDTPGTTTGFSYNSLEASNTAPQSVISTFSSEQIMDSVVNIRVNAGEISQLNNFSEVRFSSNPGRPNPPDPPNPPEPPRRTPPNVGITGHPGLYGAQMTSFTQFIGTAGGAAIAGPQGLQPGYTWHLSIINAGQPRGVEDGIQQQSVWQTASFLANEDWNRFDMDDALWTFTETKGKVGDIQLGNQQVRFGMLGGTPLAGDFDGDGTDEVAVFKDGFWLIDINRNGIWDESDLLAKLGDEQDRPVVGDWDGDGKDDIGIYGPMWQRDREAIAREPGLPNPENSPYTKPKNVPPVDHDATNGTRVMKLTSFGKQRADVVDHVFGIGDEDLIPVAGDWNGNGIRSIGTFEAGTWKLDVNGDGRFDSHDVTVQFGQAGDVPVVGDFNGDGIEEIAIYRSGTWMIDSNGNRELDATDKTFQLGDGADQPVVGDWDGDGIDEPGIYHEDRTIRFD